MSKEHAKQNAMNCLYMHSSDIAIANIDMLHTKLLGCIGWP